MLFDRLQFVAALGFVPLCFAQTDDFVSRIQPVLKANCVVCHQGAKGSGGLALDSVAGLAAVVKPGDAAGSVLLQRISSDDKAVRMPLGGNPLPPETVAAIRAWIERGAPGLSQAGESKAVHWAYVAPKRPEVPAVRNQAWVRNPIDAFILARLEKEGLSPSREATRETLIRRVSLDLIGIPPTPAEIDAFLNDTRADAYERLVERLLASPHYGERWARPWLDLARYADTNGWEKDRRRSIWKYRDWVIDALNRDLPFDQFTVEQLAADLLPKPTPTQIIATGFNRNTLFNEEGGVDKDEEMWVNLVDRVNTTATTWLGSTLGCAQCHNHKFDPFTQKEYYQFLAFFNNTAIIDKHYGDTSHKYIEPQLSLPSGEQEARRKKLQKRIDSLEAKLKTQTGKLDREQRRWEEQMRSLEGAWKPLEVTAARSEAGTKLVRREDGSWLASGENPDSDTYVIELRVPRPESVTGIRIETFPDASLPKGGPGRDAYGDFTLTAMRLETVSSSGAAQPITIARMKSDGGHVKTDKDKPIAPLWEVDASRDEKRVGRQLVCVFKEPLAVDAGVLRLTLVQASEFSGQGIGRFRVSATDAPAPLKTVQVPAEQRAVLHMDPGQRSKKQATALSDAFRKVAPSLEASRGELKARQDELEALGIPTTLVMGDKRGTETPTAVMRMRGSFLSPGETVSAGTPAALNPWPAGMPKNRLGLARWLVSPGNPLVSRVAMNRMWEQYFGHGIVETSEDFGTQGERPVNPELLDWLAVEFMSRGWSQKAMHRLIAMSATYRQDSRVTPELEQRDPYNRLLARGPRFRVEAEMVRDIVLSASGLLSEKMGGPSVFPYQPEGVWDMPYNDETWKMSTGEDRYRRGLYTFVRRTSPYPSMSVFDAPSRETCTVRRVRTNTPLQSLTTLNDPVFFEAAEALAKRVAGEAGPAPAERAAMAFRLCTGRRAKPSEIDAIVRNYESQRDGFRQHPELAAKVSSGETKDAEMAAWVMISNALLNLDETLTKE
ncbi:MAG TPA: PSD1 and planctomycete cytochrome C domain-containing protein [Bryobacteraceae bacterium]|nr:PSD1 and planctomycete cytochrome C domain-containing protein [Bryobacteraceae bacterium]